MERWKSLLLINRNRIDGIMQGLIDSGFLFKQDNINALLHIEVVISSGVVQFRYSFLLGATKYQWNRIIILSIPIILILHFVVIPHNEFLNIIYIWGGGLINFKDFPKEGVIRSFIEFKVLTVIEVGIELFRMTLTQSICSSYNIISMFYVANFFSIILSYFSF